jgi:hypothetical protein
MPAVEFIGKDALKLGNWGERFDSVIMERGGCQ